MYIASGETIGETIGETLPLALGIAISPMPIIAVILMLLGPNARRTGAGFLAGWVLGLLAATSVFVLLAGLIPPHTSSGGSNLPRAFVQLLLAALFLALAVRQWRGRPKPGVDPELPAWMAALDGFGFLRAVGLGIGLAALNPKNLLIAASAGVLIGGSGTFEVQSWSVAGLFVVCAASTVWVPVAAFLVASDRLRTPLEAARRWLVRENHTVMTVLLAFLAVLMLGKAIASF